MLVGIRFAGKPLGRPPKLTDLAKQRDLKQRRQDYRERIPIEGKFGQGKNGYDLNYIRARTAETSEAWIRSIFMVMNLLVLIRVLCVCRSNQTIRCLTIAWMAIKWPLRATVRGYANDPSARIYQRTGWVGAF